METINIRFSVLSFDDVTYQLKKIEVINDVVRLWLGMVYDDRTRKLILTKTDFNLIDTYFTKILDKKVTTPYVIQDPIDIHYITTWIEGKEEKFIHKLFSITEIYPTLRNGIGLKMRYKGECKNKKEMDHIVETLLNPKYIEDPSNEKWGNIALIYGESFEENIDIFKTNELIKTCLAYNNKLDYKSDIIEISNFPTENKPIDPKSVTYSFNRKNIILKLLQIESNSYYVPFLKSNVYLNALKPYTTYEYAFIFDDPDHLKFQQEMKKMLK